MNTKKVLLHTTERLNQVRPLNPPAADSFTSSPVLPNQLLSGIKADTVAMKQLVNAG